MGNVHILRAKQLLDNAVVDSGSVESVQEQVRASRAGSRAPHRGRVALCRRFK